MIKDSLTFRPILVIQFIQELYTMNQDKFHSTSGLLL